MTLLQMSVQAGLLILAILVVRALALNRLPKGSFLILWGIALARLLLPLSLPSPWSIIIPLLFEWITAFRVVPKKARRRQLARGAALFLIPGGFGVYCLINLAIAGNPFQFLIYQRVHWSQQPGWFFNTACYQTEMAQQCALSDLHTLLGLWLPNLLASFLSLLVMTLAVRHLRPSYTAWYLAYFLIAIGATWLLSAPRYLIALIPTPLALARLTRNPTADLVVSSVSLCGSILYFYAFVLRWQVW